MPSVLITGANRGIGLELTRQYTADGWKVIACSRTKLDGVIPLDIKDPLQIQQLATQLQNEPIDILINNAGICNRPNEELDLFDHAEWMDTFHTNTVGPYMLAKALAEKNHLKIIANISSVYGSIHLNNRGDHCIYRVSKAALNAVTKCLALDFAPKKIAVVSIHPGSVKTDMNPGGKISPSESAQGIREVLSSLTLKDSGSFMNYQREILPW
ncbi:MAG: SDR family oxidoreductase [Verrucomicrobia bacterium]|nr:SDR family oxidoreductase [Verrucomicrobiota bacterium]